VENRTKPKYWKKTEQQKGTIQDYQNSSNKLKSFEQWLAIKKKAKPWIVFHCKN
jgi:hypothetical protein